MYNLKIETVGTAKKGDLRLIITVNLTGDRSASKSGKSVIVASTQGNIPVPGMPNMKLGLNVYESK